MRRVRYRVEDTSPVDLAERHPACIAAQQFGPTSGERTGILVEREAAVGTVSAANLHGGAIDLELMRRHGEAVKRTGLLEEGRHIEAVVVIVVARKDVDGGTGR